MKDNSHKEEKPKQNHQKKRQNRQHYAAEICPTVAVVKRRAMRAKFVGCHIRTLTLLADFNAHKSRIAEKHEN